MREIILSRGERTQVDDDVFQKVGHLKWHASAYGYVVRFEGRKIVSLHRFVLGAVRGHEVDHIDRDRLNNTRANLRFCTKSQNQGNRIGSRKDGYKGVRWHKRDEAWEAYITTNMRYRSLGYFKTNTDAAKAYNTAAVAHFGEFALLNPV